VVNTGADLDDAGFCWQLAMGNRPLLLGDSAMAIAKRNEGAKVNSDINVTPMVDVMLVLLIIFMVITPMLQKGISVDMAKVNNPTPMQDADKEDALLVSVMRNGDVFFGSDKIAVDSLTGKVKDRLANRTDKRVYVKADARAHFGNVVQVVDGVRAAGVDDLGLLTDQRKSTPNAPSGPAGGQ
jgi:biopolymer transport protein ExbD/biopolymer transport protein TolR